MEKKRKKMNVHATRPRTLNNSNNDNDNNARRSVIMNKCLCLCECVYVLLCYFYYHCNDTKRKKNSIDAERIFFYCYILRENQLPRFLLLCVLLLAVYTRARAHETCCGDGGHRIFSYCRARRESTARVSHS